MIRLVGEVEQLATYVSHMQQPPPPAPLSSSDLQFEQRLLTICSIMEKEVAQLVVNALDSQNDNQPKSDNEVELNDINKDVCG